jgi:3-dehydroquinate synthase
VQPYFVTSFSTLSAFLNRHHYTAIIILVDDNTRAYCLPQLLAETPQLEQSYIIEIPSGEPFKNLDMCKRIWEQLLHWRIDRNAIMINLGGGVICDMGGFIASTYKRGIRFVNIPTTLMAMIDAAIGGKTGIDFYEYKNVIGVFNEPEAVLIYPGFLKTLPSDELMSGFAEMIKHALIGNKTLWNELQTVNPHELKDWSVLLRKAIKVKQKITGKDFRETRLRKVLNFGHTIGHAIESHFLKKNKKLLHGHAVALGMIAESFLSHKKCGLPDNDLIAIQNYLIQYYGKYASGKITYKPLKKYLINDKKNLNNQMLFSLIRSPGNPLYDVACSEQDVKNALEYLGGLL